MYNFFVLKSLYYVKVDLTIIFVITNIHKRGFIMIWCGASKL